MISASSARDVNVGSSAGRPVKFRHAAQSKEPAVFTDIYREETNIVIWQRELSAVLKGSVSDFVASNRTFQTAMTVTPQGVCSSIGDLFGSVGQSELSEDIAELVDMFCCLFELQRAGLRLTVLDRAMCPRFHVDRVPCRLVTTYQGVATQWLPHQAVDRAKLGVRGEGGADSESGLFQSQHDIRKLSNGDVALLKGELWEGNENAGLVHRSPAVSVGESRLLLTLDFSN
ncbi:DUF1826 domain-containing protein [Exilibacterium tricleocarpae]|uniref:DUF1826 domain-containing protein n=1 Tax=Exilibacterium tricleocarpae TaxID=2591008 RepID=A0A545T038_9GAMM|nr:DUF1826 domain-containing protein [Exilibacterium tricleocarpae]TQV70583.1 DUF1826 domain-containing protein [Exilibacterium tricleocarpae]